MDAQPRVNNFFYGFSGFHSIEEQALAIGLWSQGLVIGKIDKTKLTHTAADWPAKQRKGRGGEYQLPPPDGKNTIRKWQS